MPSQVLEKMAIRWHNQWVLWSKQLAKEESDVSQERLSRWKKLWCPYDELPEEQKETDRLLAKSMLMSMREGLPQLETISRREKQYGIGALASAAICVLGIGLIDLLGHGGSLVIGGAGAAVVFVVLWVNKNNGRLRFNDEIKLITGFLNEEISK